MVESLRTTHIAFFRFATPCAFFRRSGDEVQKVSVQGSVQGNHIEPFVKTSFLGTRPSCLPSPGRPFFAADDQKPNLWLGLPGSPVKTNNKVVSFSALFFMFTLMWITEKELERVIENKGDEFRRENNMEIQSGGENMRNTSDQQGENDRRWKIKANMNTGNKILGKHIRQFHHKNNV